MCAFDDQMPELQDRAAKLDATLSGLVSGQNYRLDYLGADLRPARPEPRKPTCDAEGNWRTKPAHEIDGTDKRVLRAMETK